MRPSKATPNGHRKHCPASAGQRLARLLAAKAKPLYEAEAKARQKAAGGDRKSGSANLREAIRDTGKASDHAAKAFKFSPRSVESASTVLREGLPELVEKVEKGAGKRPP